jgi:C1A family cysteine protease
MLAVGYSDKSKAFIIRNSWGEKWVNEYPFSEKFFDRFLL